jgi:predicted dehydrogenase
MSQPIVTGLTADEDRRTAQPRVRIAVIGCGAVVERFHGPALSALADCGQVEVVALCDPDAARLSALAEAFPRAATLTALTGVAATRPDLALVASPAGLHADQSIALLDAGIHVLCEKPIAAKVADAERMIAAAARARRVLAVGLFRRFLPSARLVHDLVRSGRLGAFESGAIVETGGFHWPFRSTSAFLPELTPGGILLDIGVHVFDLLTWWFPGVRVTAYEDDAMGGAEATCVATLQVARAPLTVKLSRDWPITGRYDLGFEHGRIVWDAVDPVNVQLEYRGPGADVRLAAAAVPAESWGDCFRAQLLNAICAVRGGSALVVSGSDALRSLLLIEQSYRMRTLLNSPWFSDAEVRAANEAAAERVTC